MNKRRQKVGIKAKASEYHPQSCSEHLPRSAGRREGKSLLLGMREVVPGAQREMR